MYLLGHPTLVAGFIFCCCAFLPLTANLPDRSAPRHPSKYFKDRWVLDLARKIHLDILPISSLILQEWKSL